jgi:hypothetical protein
MTAMRFPAPPPDAALVVGAVAAKLPPPVEAVSDRSQEMAKRLVRRSENASTNVCFMCFLVRLQLVCD